MPNTRIFLHADLSQATFETTDPDTFNTLRKSFPTGQSLVMAWDAGRLLTKAQPDWADTLSGLEEPSMVTLILEE